jgi:hypothetical protein
MHDLSGKQRRNGKFMVITTLLALLLVTVSSGCSGGFGTMDGIMKSWEGMHVDRVISQWATPLTNGKW